MYNSSSSSSSDNTEFVFIKEEPASPTMTSSSDVTHERSGLRTGRRGIFIPREDARRQSYVRAPVSSSSRHGTPVMATMPTSSWQPTYSPQPRPLYRAGYSPAQSRVHNLTTTTPPPVHPRYIQQGHVIGQAPQEVHVIGQAPQDCHVIGHIPQDGHGPQHGPFQKTYLYTTSGDPQVVYESEERARPQTVWNFPQPVNLTSVTPSPGGAPYLPPRGDAAMAQTVQFVPVTSPYNPVQTGHHVSQSSQTQTRTPRPTQKVIYRSNPNSRPSESVLVSRQPPSPGLCWYEPVRRQANMAVAEHLPTEVRPSQGPPRYITGSAPPYAKQKRHQQTHQIPYDPAAPQGSTPAIQFVPSENPPQEAADFPRDVIQRSDVRMGHRNDGRIESHVVSYTSISERRLMHTQEEPGRSSYSPQDYDIVDLTLNEDSSEKEEDRNVCMPRKKRKASRKDTTDAGEEMAVDVSGDISTNDEQVCNDCGMRCTQEASLKLHKQVHERLDRYTGLVKKFSCETCKSFYTLESSYTTHMKMRHNRKPRHQIEVHVSPEQQTMTQSSALSTRHVPFSPAEALSGSIDQQPSAVVNHGKHFYNCRLCERSFDLRKHLLRHQMCHEPFDRVSGALKKFTCERCQSFFTTEDFFLTHMRDSHARTRSENSTSDIEEPLEICIKPRRMSIQEAETSVVAQQAIPSKKFTDKPNTASKTTKTPARSPLSTTQPKKPMSLTNKPSTTVDSSISKSPPSVKDTSRLCTICGQWFPKMGLAKHQAVTHNPIDHKSGKEKEYACNMCQSYYMTKHNLVKHKKVCTQVQQRGAGVEPDVTRGSMKTSSYGATKGKKSCEKEAKPDKPSAGSHSSVDAQINYPKERNSNGGKSAAEFKCTLCSRRFPHNVSLALHLRLHQPVDLNGDVKQFHCEICNIYFVREYNFTAHMTGHNRTSEKKMNTTTVHEDPKETVGTNRSGDASTRGSLKTDEKKMKPGKGKSVTCDVCPRQFKNEYCMKLHMTSHDPYHKSSGLVKNYSCDECKCYYVGKQSLIEHFVLVHNQKQEDKSQRNDQATIDERVKAESD